MLDTYMKNKGTTKTIFHNNNTNTNIVKEYDWDIDYDGDKAKVSIDTKQNGKPGHYELEFDNNDLANIFKVNSVTKPINERLLDDFDLNGNNSSNPYIIKIDNTPPLLPLEMVYANNRIDNPLLLDNQNPLLDNQNSLENILHEFDEMKQNTFQEQPIILDIIKPKLKTIKKRRRQYKTQKQILNLRLPKKNITPLNITNNNIQKYNTHFRKTNKRPKIKINRVFRIPKTQIL
jgi:hypothetical protein